MLRTLQRISTRKCGHITWQSIHSLSDNWKIYQSTTCITVDEKNKGVIIGTTPPSQSPQQQEQQPTLLHQFRGSVKNTRKFSQPILSALESTFLPSGYPLTVAPGYLGFVGWQALHHSVGAANGVLASTFLLYSVGLGPGAIPTAGALSWILKDGLGQLGTLLFGRAMAHNFDVASREWYVAASVKINIAMGLEISTILAPQWFLPIASTANAIKGLAWMAGGSSRSAFNVGFALDRNIAEITAKATSQTICTSLVGTALGMAIASNIEQSVGLASGWFSVLAAIHVWTAVQSARSVPLATLNPSRLRHLCRVVVQQVEKDGGGNKENQYCLPTPHQVALHDGPALMWFGSHSHRIRPIITIGASLANVLKDSSHAHLYKRLLSLYKNKKYILLPDLRQGTAQGTTQTLYLILHRDAQTVDAVAAVLHAELLCTSDNIKYDRCDEPSGYRTDKGIVDGFEEVYRRAMVQSSDMAPRVVASLKAAGWDVQGVVLESRQRRAMW